MAAGYPDSIHLLMTDVVMPGMSGLELYREIAGSPPEMKCLYMSGDTADVLVHRGILDVDVHIIHKPFHSGLSP